MLDPPLARHRECRPAWPATMVLIVRQSAQSVTLRTGLRCPRRILASATLAQLQHAVVVVAGLAAVAGVVAPSGAVEDVLVLVGPGVEGQFRLEPARGVGPVHLQAIRLP